MKLSIIIPLYNEQDLVIQVLDEIRVVQFPQFLDSFEIIVVDDSSKDQSYERVKKYIDSSLEKNIFLF